MGQQVGPRSRASSSVRSLTYYYVLTKRFYRRNRARVAFAVLAIGFSLFGYLVSFEYAFEPAARNLVVDPATLLGRKQFYTETEGNEIFLSDVAGILSGAIRFSSFTKALIALSGRGTSNLQIEVARDIRIGNQEFVKGQLFDTGLDVPKGAWAPLGVKFVKKRGVFKMGMTCAACHSTVDANFEVLEGLPNANLNFGAMLAMASNSAAFVAFTDRDDYLAIDTAPKRNVAAGTKVPIVLPDPGTLEVAVDTRLSRWPPGAFDSSPDFIANPINIPTVLGGRSMKDCRWLSHLLELKGETRQNLRMGQEQYLGVLLQNSPRRAFRFRPDKKRPPSAYLPPVVELDSSDIQRWMHGLLPPVELGKPRQASKGRKVFEKARCVECHSDSDVPALTGLSWSAPYLRDGGVAVGRRPARQLGVPGTLLQWVSADSTNSLNALIDRKLRGPVVLMNRSHPDLRAVRVTGAGHEYWVDEEAGYTREDKALLIDYLLAL